MPETKRIDDEGLILDEAVCDIIATQKPGSGNHALAKTVPGAILLESFSGDIIVPAPAPGATEKLSVLESPVIYIPCVPTDGSDEAIIGQFEDLFESAGIAFPDDFPWLEHIVRLIGTDRKKSEKTS